MKKVHYIFSVLLLGLWVLPLSAQSKIYETYANRDNLQVYYIHNFPLRDDSIDVTIIRADDTATYYALIDEIYNGKSNLILTDTDKEKLAKGHALYCVSITNNEDITKKTSPSDTAMAYVIYPYLYRMILVWHNPTEPQIDFLNSVTLDLLKIKDKDINILTYFLATKHDN